MRVYHQGLCSVIVAEDWVEQEAVEKVTASIKSLLLNGRQIQQSFDEFPVGVALGLVGKSATKPEAKTDHAEGQRVETARLE